MARNLGKYPSPEHQVSKLVIESIFGSIPSEEIARYNKELENFQKNYERFLHDDIRFRNMMRRSKNTKIWLHNEGNAPAEDIDIILQFPNEIDSFRILRELQPPKRPRPPSKPLNQMERLMTSAPIPGYSIEHTPLPEVTISNVSGLNIRRINGYELDFHVRQLKHKLIDYSDPFFMVFGFPNEAQSFQIDYKIIAANVPDVVAGQLHVIVKRP